MDRDEKQIKDVEGHITGELENGAEVEIELDRDAVNSEVRIGGEKAENVKSVKIWADGEHNTVSGRLTALEGINLPSAQQIIDSVEEEMP